MQAEIISVGTELLLGQIVDTNAAYISRRLSELGINLYFRSTVGDNYRRMKEVISRAVNRSDLVLITGGLGPTMDDRTREVVADIFDSPLACDPEQLERIEKFFFHLDKDMTPNNKKQALIPLDGEALPNSCGTAPGIYLSKGNRTAVLLPGVPDEMETMMEDQVIPRLKDRFLSQQVIRSCILRLFGIGESTLETQLNDLLSSQDNPTLALLASKGEVHIRITARASGPEEAENMINALKSSLYARVGDYIYAEGELDLPAVVGNLLKERKMTIAVAESCTGGLIGDLITGVSGSSAYFDRGYVTYSNRAKRELLGVRAETLNKHGAVSRPVALEMARGAQMAGGVDVAVSATGIAGPTGSTPDKPIGMVFIALSGPQGTRCKRCNFTGNRKDIKYRTALTGLNMIREYLIDSQSADSSHPADENTT